MTWTPPKTWQVDEVVTADMMNTHLRDNLTHLHLLFDNITILQDEKTTDGGSFIATDWRTRELNTIYGNQQNMVSLSANQFTLQPGRYFIYGSAPAYSVLNHQTRLQNSTYNTTEQIGTSETISFGSESVSRSHLMALLTVNTETTYEFQHRCTLHQNTYGLGVSTGWGTNVYAQVLIWCTG